MSTTDTTNETASDGVARRAAELFNEALDKIHRRTDRMFAGLMVFQWLAGVAAAVWISPRTWIGTQSQIHIHVWAALFIGAVITGFPVALAFTQPGRPLTRHAVAAGQMLTSALLIHLTGGRIETHFHVFGSLAFLAFYRDWKVLATATAVVAADHAFRGLYWPQSVFGVLAASPLAGSSTRDGVVFEDFFLLLSVHQALGEIRLVAERRAALEATNERIEEQVRERTRELEESQQKLIETSRQAGMAEVATSVLHNVGNVLNSVNISTTTVANRIRNSQSEKLGKVAGLLRENSGNLAHFVTEDPKGKHVPVFLEQLAGQLAQEKNEALEELKNLAKYVDHIKDVVAVQQSYAKVSGVTEKCKVTDLVEDAIRMNASALIRHDVRFFREYAEPLPEVQVEKHKVLQILVNLIRNAKYACDESGLKDKRLTVRITNGGDSVRIAMIDNGVGIPSENMDRIFNHGFTTRGDSYVGSGCIPERWPRRN